MAVTLGYIGSQPKLAVGTSAHASRARRILEPRSAGALAQLAAFPLRQPAPDAEPLVVGQCVLEALGPHLARSADALCVAGGAALLREEGLGVGLSAQRIGLPGQRVVVVDSGPDAGDTERDGIDEPIVGDSGTIFRNCHIGLPPLTANHA